MKRMLYSITSLLLIAVMNLFVMGAHSSAMSMSSSHSTSGMKHAKTSVSCISLCASATSYRLSDLEIIENEDDDEPSAPFYLAFQQPLYSLNSHHTAVAREAVKFEPPPGLPAYIQFAVFRT